MTIKIDHITKSQTKNENKSRTKSSAIANAINRQALSEEETIMAWLQSAPPKVDWDKEYELIPGVKLCYISWVYLAHGAAECGVTLEEAWHQCGAYYNSDPIIWHERDFRWIDQENSPKEIFRHVQKLVGVKPRHLHEMN